MKEKERVLGYIRNHKPSLVELIAFFGNAIAVKNLDALMRENRVVCKSDGIWPWYQELTLNSTADTQAPS